MHSRGWFAGASHTHAAKTLLRCTERVAFASPAAQRPCRGQHKRTMTISAAAPDSSAQQGIIANEVLVLELATRAPVASSETYQPQSQNTTEQSTKTIYLIRHGEGWHNIGYDHNYDPHLTPRGWAQTGALQQHLAALQTQLGIELVVVSPLRRTLETAAGVFGASAPPAALQAAKAAGAVSAATAASNGNTGNWVWMHPQGHKPEEVTRRDVIFLPVAGYAAAAAAAACTGEGAVHSSSTAHQSPSEHQPLRILAYEGCRERIGTTVCDKFRDIPLQMADFPGVDFSLLRHTTDVEWERLHAAATQDGGCYLIGEEEAAIEQRALTFYRWLLSRPESRIAVVSHCGFLVHGMRALGKTMLNTWSDAMLEQCSNSSTASSTAAMRPVDGSSTAGIASSKIADLQQAELLRTTAGHIAGRMSIDWMNCEMRSIQLRWAPTGLHAAGEPVDGKEGWLWASPGDAAEWFPGGLTGL